MADDVVLPCFYDEVVLWSDDSLVDAFLSCSGVL